MPTIISDAGALGLLGARLASGPRLAVDLEGDSLHHYRERICLLQVSVPGADFIIDTLAIGDLEPLRTVFADPGVTKIFHAGDFDLRSLWRDFRIEVRGLVDTMVASQLLGEEKIGLADLLARHFGVTMDKRFQQADWSRRPLPPEMIAYAAEDTRHLARLADLLEAELAARNRLEWAREEWSLLERIRPTESEAPSWQRVKGAQLLGRRELAVLDELVRWREGEAERRDLPPFKVVGNESLLEATRLLPREPRDLRRAAPAHRRLIERYGGEILAAVKRGINLPEENLPVRPDRERRRRDPAFEKRLERLKSWRTRQAAKLAIAPGVLINNALLEAIAQNPPGSVDDLDRYPAMKGWQRLELGEGIIAALVPEEAGAATP